MVQTVGASQLQQQQITKRKRKRGAKRSRELVDGLDSPLTRINPQSLSGRGSDSDSELDGSKHPSKSPKTGPDANNTIPSAKGGHSSLSQPKKSAAVSTAPGSTLLSSPSVASSSKPSKPISPVSSAPLSTSLSAAPKSSASSAVVKNGTKVVNFFDNLNLDGDSANDRASTLEGKQLAEAGKSSKKRRIVPEATHLPDPKQFLDARKALPVWSARASILHEVRSSNAVVIVGETGSGKTTQIPQFLYEAGLTSKGMIAVTQPRRVAAISIAKRVSEEMGTALGTTVGYSIRFEDCTSSQTKIKYMTDGMLLRELLSDNQLKRYSTIVLDEAHERTLRTDVLFGMIKSIQRERPDLRVVVMSATLNAEKFSKFFGNAKILHIHGRQFPVEIFHAPERLEDHVDSALVSIFQTHLEQPPGDILVFLTGQEEIENLEKLIGEHTHDLPHDADKMLVCPIFAAMPTSQQSRVFEPTPHGTRKIILSTNIAETSITISGVRYVIDTGLAKVRSYNPKIGLESLKIEPISKASASQRTGRAGREAPGICFRLYPEEDYLQLDEETEPEIKRVNLASVLLLLKASGVSDIFNFDYIDRPSRDGLVRALEQLYALSALDERGQLTELGRQMSLFPLDPQFSKVLIKSKVLKCTFEAIAIVSLLSVDNVFYTPNNKREEAAEAKKKFLNYDGDHLTLLNALQAYQSVDSAPGTWCQDNFISHRALKQALEIRTQLNELCEQVGIDHRISSGSNSSEAVLRCFLEGWFTNVAVREPNGVYRTLVHRQEVHIHPSSVLFNRKPTVLMFTELVHTSKKYMRNVSEIQLDWAIQAAPQYYSRTSG